MQMDGTHDTNYLYLIYKIMSIYHTTEYGCGPVRSKAPLFALWGAKLRTIIGPKQIVNAYSLPYCVNQYKHDPDNDTYQHAVLSVDTRLGSTQLYMRVGTLALTQYACQAALTLNKIICTNSYSKIITAECT